jgi:tetratricopeptide (TPR) repeat protein
VWAWLTLALPLLAPAARAADLDDAHKLYKSGKYAECVAACAEAISDSRLDEGWWLLKIKAEMAAGQYPQALQTYQAALDRHERSIPLLMAGYDVLRANDKPREADEALIVIRALASRTPWRYADAASRTALGRSLLLSGADARQVLVLFYVQAKKV